MIDFLIASLIYSAAGAIISRRVFGWVLYKNRPEAVSFTSSQDRRNASTWAIMSFIGWPIVLLLIWGGVFWSLSSVTPAIGPERKYRQTVKAQRKAEQEARALAEINRREQFALSDDYLPED